MSVKNLDFNNTSSRKFPMKYTRNIGIVAHIDAGKTTTTERMLFYSGVVHKMGEVHDGNSITDWMDQERERGITITSAAVSCNWKNQIGLFPNIVQQINIIDTPGHVDFTAEVERSLRVLDGAIGVFCGVSGVQPQSETVWRQMEKYNVPRLAFINKIDRLGANYYTSIKSIRDKLKVNAQAIYIPIQEEDNFSGLINLITMKAYFFNAKDKMGITYETKDIPEAFIEKANKYREILIENLSDFDDEIAKHYIEGLDIDPNLIFNAIREATIALKLCPVLPGSALKNKGIQFLMDAVIDFLPSPTDLPPISANDLQGKDELIEHKEDNKLCGLAFKLMNDEYVGKLVFFRIYSGTLKKGASLLNPRTNKTERISRILRMKANDREDIDIAYAGDICALVGLREVFTGDTLCDKSQVLVLEPPVFPETVISMSIEPKTSSDKDKLELGLKKLTEEDPTFFVKVNEDTSQTIISGMGELHLEIIRDRLLREFQVKAEAGKPQIAYRETINNSAQAEGKFDRKIGEINHFAEISIKLKPLERGQGINIDCSIESNLIPKEYLDICVGGIKEASKNGSLAGYQLTDFSLDIYDGIYREVDSSEMAFKMAGIFALRNALEVANPILLEPIMEVQVETPEEYQGDIIGDLNRKRGQIRSIDTNNNYVLISSLVPLAEMFGYSTIVRSLSKGRASYTMKPKLFEEVPQNILKSILNPNHLTN